MSYEERMNNVINLSPSEMSHKILLNSKKNLNMIEYNHIYSSRRLQVEMC